MGEFAGGFSQGFGQQFQAQQRRGLELTELKLRQQQLKSEDELNKLRGQKLLMEIQQDPNAFLEKMMPLLRGEQPGPSGTLPQAPMGAPTQGGQGGIGGLELGGVTVGPSGPSISFRPPGEPKLPAGTSTELAGALRELGIDPTQPGNFTQENVAKANRLLQVRRVEISAAQGAAGVGARAGAEREQPVAEKAPFWINPQTGKPATPDQTVTELIGKGFVPVTEGGLTAVASAKSALAQLKEYRSLAKQFLVEGTGSLGRDILKVQSNRATLFARRRAGDPAVKKFDALAGAIATLARATGDTANIAVQERRALQEFVITDEDTLQSAVQKLDQAERILRAVAEGRGIPLPPGGNGGDLQIRKITPVK